MKSILAFLIVLLSACSEISGTEPCHCGAGPSCAAPMGTSSVANSSVTQAQGSCLAGTTSPQQDVAVVAHSAAELAAAWSPSCGFGPPTNIDFSSSQLLLLRTSNGMINFLTEDAQALHLGVLHYGAGFLNDQLLVLSMARSTKQIQVSSCMETCTGTCPVLP
jgi:hypothetical protein